MKPERRMKSAGCQSYSKRQIVPAKCIAVCFAIFALVSCEKNNGHSMFQTSESAVNSYRAYLSEMRSVESLPTEHLIEAVNDWQTLRDSVFACVAKDTANRIHSNHENTIHSLHDSLQADVWPIQLQKHSRMYCSSRSELPLTGKMRNWQKL